MKISHNKLFLILFILFNIPIAAANDDVSQSDVAINSTQARKEIPTIVKKIDYKEFDLITLDDETLFMFDYKLKNILSKKENSKEYILISKKNKNSEQNEQQCDELLKTMN